DSFTRGLRRNHSLDDSHKFCSDRIPQVPVAMNIYAVGTSHKHSPLDVRERLVFSEEELGPALRDLNSGIAEEAAIVSTCNRTEIYIVAKDEFFHADQLKDWLCRWKKVSVPHGQL